MTWLYLARAAAVSPVPYAAFPFSFSAAPSCGFFRVVERPGSSWPGYSVPGNSARKAICSPVDCGQKKSLQY